MQATLRGHAMAELLQAFWRIATNPWVLSVVSIITIGVVFITRAVGPLAGRWGYEKFVTERKSKQKDRKRRSQIRILLINSLERNLALLADMERDMQGKTIDKIKRVPTYNVDLPLLESTAGLTLLDVIDDMKTYNLIDKARFELVNLSHKITWLADMYFRRPKELPGPTAPPSSTAADNVYYDVARSTLRHVQDCQAECRKAIDALKYHEEMSSKPKKRWLNGPGLLRKKQAGEPGGDALAEGLITSPLAGDASNSPGLELRVR
jgi:hypothetical protein